MRGEWEDRVAMRGEYEREGCVRERRSEFAWGEWAWESHGGPRIPSHAHSTPTQLPLISLSHAHHSLSNSALLSHTHPSDSYSLSSRLPLIAPLISPSRRRRGIG